MKCSVSGRVKVRHEKPGCVTVGRKNQEEYIKGGITHRLSAHSIPKEMVLLSGREAEAFA